MDPCCPDRVVLVHFGNALIPQVGAAQVLGKLLLALRPEKDYKHDQRPLELCYFCEWRNLHFPDSFQLNTGRKTFLKRNPARMSDTNVLLIGLESVIGIAVLVGYLLTKAYNEIGRELPCRPRRPRRS